MTKKKTKEIKLEKAAPWITHLRQAGWPTQGSVSCGTAVLLLPLSLAPRQPSDEDRLPSSFSSGNFCTWSTIVGAKSCFLVRQTVLQLHWDNEDKQLKGQIKNKYKHSLASDKLGTVHAWLLL